MAGITGGLYRFKRGMFTGITHRRGLAPGTVEALVERRDGTLIAAVGPETLFKIDQGRVTQRIEIPEAPNTRAAALFEDSRGVLWIGTYQGLLGIGPQERRHFSSASGFPSSQIRAIREDRFGSLWIGTANRGMIEMRPDDSLRVPRSFQGTALQLSSSRFPRISTKISFSPCVEVFMCFLPNPEL